MFLTTCLQLFTCHGNGQVFHCTGRSLTCLPKLGLSYRATKEIFLLDVNKSSTNIKSYVIIMECNCNIKHNKRITQTMCTFTQITCNCPQNNIIPKSGKCQSGGQVVWNHTLKKRKKYLKHLFEKYQFCRKISLYKGCWNTRSRLHFKCDVMHWNKKKTI